MKLSRAQLARFVRIISGHNSLFYFRSKIDEECRFCREDNETFEHFANTCPRFIQFRRDTLYNQLITNDHMWSVQMLIVFSYLPGINDALEGDTRLNLHLQYEDSDISSEDSESNRSNKDDDTPTCHFLGILEEDQKFMFWFIAL